MESFWPSDAQGIGTSSGSGADFHTDGFSFSGSFSWTNNEVTDALDTEMVYMAEASYGAGGDLKPGERFNAKTAPAFNGLERWYIFEELVWDWCDITIVDQEKRGPHLRNRLTGDAIVYKPQMDKEKLKTEDGVKYFLDFLRPLHLQDADAVFLFRLVQYMRIHRGKLDFGKWCSKFDVMKLRLFEAWKDTCELAFLKPGESIDSFNEEVRSAARAEGRLEEMGSMSPEDKL